MQTAAAAPAIIIGSKVQWHSHMTNGPHVGVVVGRDGGDWLVDTGCEVYQLHATERLALV